ncbi:outer membrane beta-barrel protein [Chryseolinea soli]|uniref:Outer membrane protein beta-barrel domain-containing protein n=1 Tax=Chryseolinea soli TaxID=2321403 RepID=A0A385SI90_9BACT|nr:outer membrane beta-barrel protein [Chryseolinea soli]AYB30017.1 hypothetical protein D4L85_05240 [Chryseolinea soli]
MKKLLWIMCVIPLVSHGQFKKGDTYVGGSFSRIDNGNGLYITPFVGYFINPRLALGADLQVGYSRSEDISQFGDGPHRVINTTNGFVTSLTARRLYSISEKFFFALQGAASYQRSLTKREVPDLTTTSRSNSYGLGLSVAPLFMYFPSSRWSVEGGLGSLYYSFSRGLSDNTKYQSVGLNLGRVTLGFAYYFRK